MEETSFSTLLSAGVIIPAHNEEAHLGGLLDSIAVAGERYPGHISKVVVVDDHSTDATAEVARSRGVDVLTVEGREGAGKGQALWTGYRALETDIVVACDADLVDFDATRLVNLITALERSPDLVMAKAAYDSDLLDDSYHRVTTLTALPLLEYFFPELSQFKSPLAGEFALRRSALQGVSVLGEYGVDVALLIDLALTYGATSVVEVSFGTKQHRHHSTNRLKSQASQVAGAILSRAILHGRGIAGSIHLVHELGSPLRTPMATWERA